MHREVNVSYEDLENSLHSLTDTEFAKRNSILSEEIEKEFSRLAAKSLLSSGVAVTKATELCIVDLTERVHFISEKIKVIVYSKNISYKEDLRKKANDLLIEFGEIAKENCSDICSKAVNLINTGSVKGSLQRIDYKFQLELKEVLNETEIYFDDLKNNSTFTFKGWFKSNTTPIVLIIITAIVAYLIGKIP